MLICCPFGLSSGASNNSSLSKIKLEIQNTFFWKSSEAQILSVHSCVTWMRNMNIFDVGPIPLRNKQRCSRAFLGPLLKTPAAIGSSYTWDLSFSKIKFLRTAPITGLAKIGSCKVRVLFLLCASVGVLEREHLPIYKLSHILVTCLIVTLSHMYIALVAPSCPELHWLWHDLCAVDPTSKS